MGRGQEVIMEPGSMVHADEGVEPVTATTNIVGALIANQDIFQLKWRNKCTSVKYLSATSAVPSKIIPIDLSVYR
eukprot:757252-Hanusia_phi.AAC.1